MDLAHLNGSDNELTSASNTTSSPLEGGLGLLSTPPPLPTSFLPSSDVAVVLADPEATARLVEQVLERAGMSQREVARRLGVAPQSLNQYAKSRRSNPSVSWLAKLVEVCGGQLLIRFPR